MNESWKILPGEQGLSVISAVVSVVSGRLGVNGVSGFVYDSVEAVVVIGGVGHLPGGAIWFD